MAGPPLTEQVPAAQAAPLLAAITATTAAAFTQLNFLHIIRLSPI
jgi:hypothetical protein